jgi:hypothetical protein
MLATAYGATAMAGGVSGPHVLPANERVTDGTRTRALRSHNPCEHIRVCPSRSQYVA